MKKSIEQIENEIVTQFAALENWEARYKKIIEMGKALPEMPEKLKTEDRKVKGCQSQVWLFASLDEQKSIHYQADSDALIVKGLVAVLVSIYSNQDPELIMKHQPDFIKKMGFEENLSPSRANGLASMIKQMKLYAMAFFVMKTQK